MIRVFQIVPGTYRLTYDIRGMSPSALLQIYLYSRLNIGLQWIGQRQLQDKAKNIEVLVSCASYTRGLTVIVVCQ